MGIFASFFPILGKIGWEGSFAETLPYFFRLKPEVKSEAVLVSLDTIRTQDQQWQQKYGSQYITFTFSSIALAAKLIHIDGEATKAEIEAFYQYFPMPGGSKDRGAELFYQAYLDTADTRLYAQKIVNFYPGKKGFYTQLIQALIQLAFADAPMNNQEYTLIRKIAAIFEITEAEFNALLRQHIMPKGSDPYALLGTKRRITHDDIKKAYREIIKDCHPDTFGRYDLAPEIKSLLIEKFKRLTNAYEAICKFRKF